MQKYLQNKLHELQETLNGDPLFNNPIIAGINGRG
jgi:hypothetical protein